MRKVCALHRTADSKHSSSNAADVNVKITIARSFPSCAKSGRIAATFYLFPDEVKSAGLRDHEPTALVEISDGKARLIRKRQTFDDLIRGEMV